jgi:hypothetical protein
VLHQISTKFATKLLAAQRHVPSKVLAEILEMFTFAHEDQAIQVTKANFKGLTSLCDGFASNEKAHHINFLNFIRWGTTDVQG